MAARFLAFLLLALTLEPAAAQDTSSLPASNRGA